MADVQTFAEQMVAKIEAVLLKKADNDVLEYEINGRQLKKYTFGDLEILRQKYKKEVAAEKAAANLEAGIKPNRRVLVRFSS
ncbi:MAG TPA: hypothetical protein CFH81_00375 [Sulfurovum sp. UBA12169]|nr:MAG TPA: hypothetical protein CFH81_00375 [Sulfurovum sp. UBA12169]